MINPTYVERGGELVFPPPFVAEGVQFFGFVVEAGGAALQHICDKYLNEPGGVRRFRPAVEQVLFVFNRMDRMYAEQHPWRERGEFKEMEAAVWMLVRDEHRRKLCWFHPYMIVDGVHTLVTGREVYGFPKTLGTFEVPDGPAPPRELTVDTAVVECFGVGAPVKHLRLITARATRKPDEVGCEDLESIEALAERVLRAAQFDRHMAAGAVAPDVVDTLRNVRVPDFLFLKQFRDGSRGTGAGLRSVETATVEMTRFHGARLFGSTDEPAYEIDLGDFASHDIRGELGLGGGAVPVTVAFWAKFDFRVGPCTTLHVPPPAKKQKVVILGGGIGAVTTAIRLTNDEGWRDRFESITLYQMGWRLGGKGATGRGPHHTIEEHGLHVWLGFYENAFQTIRDIYRSAGRTGSSVSEWCPGFTKHHFIGVNELVGAKWHPWMFEFPPRGGEPGAGDRVGPLREGFAAILRWCGLQIERLSDVAWTPRLVGAAERLVREAEAFRGTAALVEDPFQDDEVIAQLSGASDRLAEFLLPEDGATAPSDRAGDRVAGFRDFGLGDLDLRVRRALLLALMGVTVTRGLLVDRVFSYDDLARLENEDVSRWLKRHLDRRAVWDPQENPLVRGLYDFAFAYAGGDVDRPDFAAGPALRTVLRMCLTYKGAVFFKMNAGMGDTVFAPAYEALIRRGVRVEFFHKVANLGLSPDKRRVQTIEMEVQATLKPGHTIYHPLVEPPCVGGAAGRVPSWPRHPRYELLAEGDELERGGIDLESFWTKWRAPGRLVLEADKDFDSVVLGVSVGSVPYLCAELVEASPRWRRMTQRVATVSTQALQVWTKKPLRELGWEDPSPVLDAWVQPLNTWADLTLVRDFECWPDEARPGSVAYFCGPRPGDIPPQSDHGFPARAHEEVRRTAERMLAEDVGTLWPRLGAGGLPPEERAHTYCRANINPSDRYVLSLAGSAGCRLAANESGFQNLVLAGDWIRTGYNAGCVEAATWSGFQAANTILGLPLNDGVIS